MKRLGVAFAVALMAAGTLSGCGSDPYCDAVKTNTTALNNFGQSRTNKDFTKYAGVMDSIAKQAPSDVKKDWSTLGAKTREVLAAQKDVGLKLEEMKDTKKVAKLSTAQLKKVNDAYLAFNGTTKERTAVVKNVKKECKITLK